VPPVCAASCGRDPFLAKLVGSVIDDAPVSNKETTEVRLIVLFFDDLSVFVPSDTGGVFCLSVDTKEG
jgi:hypothetical protein